MARPRAKGKRRYCQLRDKKLVCLGGEGGKWRTYLTLRDLSLVSIIIRFVTGGSGKKLCTGVSVYVLAAPGKQHGRSP